MINKIQFKEKVRKELLKNNIELVDLESEIDYTLTLSENISHQINKRSKFQNAENN